MSKHFLGLYWISQYILVSEKMYLFPGYGEKVAQKKNIKYLKQTFQKLTIDNDQNLSFGRLIG